MWFDLWFVCTKRPSIIWITRECGDDRNSKLSDLVVFSGSRTGMGFYVSKWKLNYIRPYWDSQYPRVGSRRHKRRKSVSRRLGGISQRPWICKQGLSRGIYLLWGTDILHQVSAWPGIDFPKTICLLVLIWCSPCLVTPPCWFSRHSVDQERWFLRGKWALSNQ